jgi:hypothetical protein
MDSRLDARTLRGTAETGIPTTGGRPRGLKELQRPLPNRMLQPAVPILISVGIPPPLRGMRARRVRIASDADAPPRLSKLWDGRPIGPNGGATRLTSQPGVTPSLHPTRRVGCLPTIAFTSR